MEPNQSKESWLPWYQKPYTGNLAVLVLVLFAIFLTHMILPLLESIFAFLFAVLFPFFLSLIIYYALRPIVEKLHKKLPIDFAVSVVYVLLLAAIAFIVFYIYPIIVKEIFLVKTIDVKNVSENIFNTFNIVLTNLHLDLTHQDETKDFISFSLDKLNNFMTGSLLNFMTGLTTFLLDLVMIPFILFFLLKDDQFIYSGFSQKIPHPYHNKISTFLCEVDKVLVQFISGRIIVSACISALLFITFFIIGIDSYYILAAIAFLFFIIPSVGWILASILPLLVGFSMNTATGIEVLIVMLVAAFLEGFWLTPEILGKSLTIHPLTIILLLLGSGYLFGIFGLIFVTPAYALLKVLVIHLYSEFVEAKT